MANSENVTRCYPFSSQQYNGHLYCCNTMNLVSALNHTFKCLTCLMQRNAPPGVSPIFPPNHCAYEHIANNHILVCLICQSKIFQGTWCKDKAFAHISHCIVQATYKTSRPFVCMPTSCLHTLWIT